LFRRLPLVSAEKPVDHSEAPVGFLEIRLTGFGQAIRNAGWEARIRSQIHCGDTPFPKQLLNRMHRDLSQNPIVSQKTDSFLPNVNDLPDFSIPLKCRTHR
jgi:hypothetical protein